MGGFAKPCGHESPRPVCTHFGPDRVRSFCPLSEGQSAARRISAQKKLMCARPTQTKFARPIIFPLAKTISRLPGNAAVEGDDFLPASAFPDAAYCGHCHQEAYHEWRQALHSNSFRTPFYRASVNILIRTKGIEFARHCDSCHNPIGVLAGALNTGSTLDRSFDRDGLTCTTCHSIQSVQTKLGNGSFVMGVPAVMVDEQGNRIPGIVPDAEILAHPDRHSKAVMQDIYHYAGVLLRMPQGESAPAAERLQMDSRLYRL